MGHMAFPAGRVNWPRGIEPHVGGRHCPLVSSENRLEESLPRLILRRNALVNAIGRVVRELGKVQKLWECVILTVNALAVPLRSNSEQLREHPGLRRTVPLLILVLEELL